MWVDEGQQKYFEERVSFRVNEELVIKRELKVRGVWKDSKKRKMREKQGLGKAIEALIDVMGRGTCLTDMLGVKQGSS